LHGKINISVTFLPARRQKKVKLYENVYSGGRLVRIASYSLLKQIYKKLV